MYRFTKSPSLAILTLAIFGIIAIQSFDLFGHKKNSTSLDSQMPVTNDY